MCDGLIKYTVLVLLSTTIRSVEKWYLYIPNWNLLSLSPLCLRADSPEDDASLNLSTPDRAGAASVSLSISHVVDGKLIAQCYKLWIFAKHWK